MSKNGKPIAFPSRRALHVLARLALLRGDSIERRPLADSVWPQLDGEDALAALRRELYRIDAVWQAYSKDVLVLRDRRSLRLDGSVPLEVDALRFDQLYANGLLTEAVELYSAELCESFSDAVIDRERQVFAAKYAAALDQLVAQATAEGRLAQAVVLAGRRLRLDPYHEPAVRTLMRLQNDAGNRNDAFTTYRAFEALIASELGAKPLSATTALFDDLADDEGIAAAAKSALPAEQGALLGRDREIAKISELLERHGCVTLTGPPGIGKSRLSVRVARLRETAFEGGAYFVDLSAASAPGDVERLVLEVLYGRPQSTSKSPERFFSSQSALLILDNCEHVSEECAAIVVRLSRNAPQVRVLATSRRPLRTPAEIEWRLEPLSLPEPDASPAAAARSPAVQLFLERAERVRSFDRPRVPLATAVSISTLLDGVPLALELAASRLRLLAPAELESLLLAREPVLAAGREAGSDAKDAPYAWSFTLLSPPARAAFARLGVFRSAFTLEAARAVCADLGIAAIDALSELVEHSMVLQREPGEPISRLTLLFSAREFALEVLERSGDREATRSRHAEFHLARASSLALSLAGAERTTAFRTLQLETHDILAALDFAIVEGRCVEDGLSAAVALGRFWPEAFLNKAGFALIEAGLRHDSGPGELIARARLTASVLARQSGDIQRSFELASGARDLFVSIGDLAGESRALVALGNSATVVGDASAAHAYGIAALNAARRTGSNEMELYAELMLAQLKMSIDDVGEARARFAHAAQLATACNFVREILVCLNNLAVCALFEDDLGSANEYATSALERGRALFLPENVAWALSVLATVAWRRADIASAVTLSQEVALAARKIDARILEIRVIEDAVAYLAGTFEVAIAASLLGGADAARQLFAQPLQPIEIPPRTRLEAEVAGAIGAASYAANHSIGATWSIEESLDRALAAARRTVVAPMQDKVRNEK